MVPGAPAIASPVFAYSTGAPGGPAYSTAGPLASVPLNAIKPLEDVKPQKPGTSPSESAANTPPGTPGAGSPVRATVINAPGRPAKSARLLSPVTPGPLRYVVNATDPSAAGGLMYVL